MRHQLIGSVRSHGRCAWLLGALACLAAGSAPAQTPDPQAAATPPAAPAAAPAATQSTQAAPAATASPATPVAPATEAKTADGAREIPSGYRRTKRKGQEVYCRKVTTIGTRFADELCFTREQLEEVVDRTDSAMDDLNQAMKVCAGGGACQVR